MPELVPAEPRTPDWHAARRGGVTATDIVTILGLSTWDSVYSLFWRKMQQAPEVEDNDRFRLGRELEEYIALRWHEANEHQSLYGGALYRSHDRPWQMATPDKLLGVSYDDWRAVLEVKTWADADKPSWDAGPPATVRAQVLWQMDVMDVAAGHVGVVFLPSGEFRSYTIEHDGPRSATEAIEMDVDVCTVCADQSLMRQAGEEFMARLRLELPPPDPDSSAATLAAVRARFARQPAKQAEVDQGLWNAWVSNRFLMAQHEELARGLEIQLREQAGEAAELTVDGQLVARRVIVDAKVKAHTRHQDYLRRVERLPDSEYEGTGFASDPVSDLIDRLKPKGDDSE